MPVSVYQTKAKWISEQIQNKLKLLKSDPSYYAYILMSVEDEERLATIYNVFRDAIRKSYLLRPAPPISSGQLIAIEARVSPIAEIK
ncbi:MAG: hypothetical protein HY075_03060 [Deltaproteobacteria bacterium]|nr:hypothetical protein [Deltaproteobacteria bacterium]